MNRRLRIIVALSMILAGLSINVISDAFAPNCEYTCCKQCDE